MAFRKAQTLASSVPDVIDVLSVFRAAPNSSPRADVMSRGSVWPQGSHRCVRSDKVFFRTCPHSGHV